MKLTKQESQMKQIERDLLRGRKVSPHQALRDYGCMRLSARIWDLRKYRHLNIDAVRKHEGDLTWAEYRLVK